MQKESIESRNQVLQAKPEVSWAVYIYSQAAQLRLSAIIFQTGDDCCLLKGRLLRCLALENWETSTWRCMLFLAAWFSASCA